MDRETRENDEIVALEQQLIRIKEIVREKDQQFEDARSKNKIQERVIQYLRERSEEAHLEIHHLQHELDTALEKNPAKNDEFQAIQLAKQSMREKEQAQHEREKMGELLRQKEKVLEESKSHLQLYIQKKKQLEENLRFAQAAAKENEEQLRCAQQHLGKKLKETAELSEANQKIRQEFLELKKSVDNFQIQAQMERKKSAEFDTTVLALKKEKERLNGENQLLQTQLNEARKKMIEFQKLEGQYHQLKMLLTTMKEVKEPEAKEEELDLFTQDKPSLYYKKSLFE